MKRGRSLVPTAAAALGLALTAPAVPTHACSPAAPSFHSPLPAHATTGVPTDAALSVGLSGWYDRSMDRVEGTILAGGSPTVIEF